MGGTGLVGRALLDRLARDLDYAGVTAIGRRAVAVPGVHDVVLDNDALAPEHVPASATAAFCCLGTTIKKAGSQDAFRAIDHELVLRFARACKARNVRTFHVVSAMGADPQARVFYTRVKGEMERDLANVGFESACAYRPSYLLGDRDEFRPGERAGIVAIKLLRPVLPRRLHGVPVDVVARAMANHAKHATPGFHVHRNDELWALAGETS